MILILRGSPAVIYLDDDFCGGFGCGYYGCDCYNGGYGACTGFGDGSGCAGEGYMWDIAMDEGQ